MTKTKTVTSGGRFKFISGETEIMEMRKKRGKEKLSEKMMNVYIHKI